MARINFTSILSAVKGRLAGSVFQQSNGGAQIRSLPLPFNRHTQSQQFQRSNFRTIVSIWRTLTLSQMQSWIDAAPTPSEGFNFFTASQLALASAGLPLSLTYSPASPASPIPIFFPVVGPSSLIIQASSSYSTIPAGSYLTLLMPPIFPQSIDRPPYNAYSPIRTFAPGTDLSTPQEIQPDYIARYGTIPDSGRLCYRILMTSGANGARSNSLQNCFNYSII